MRLLGHGGQTEFKLGLCLHHATSLVPDMLQGGGYVYLFGPLAHSVEHHVQQHIGARSSNSITAVDYDGTRSASVGLVHLPSKL